VYSEAAALAALLASAENDPQEKSAPTSLWQNGFGNAHSTSLPRSSLNRAVISVSPTGSESRLVPLIVLPGAT
jgi:hypothetical protein